MTGTSLAVRPQPAAAIPAKLAYANALADSGLLPAAYRKQPANVLWAMEYGEMLGLHTVAAMTGVHVIDGKPTASAGLISGLVRQAGHKLRIRGDGTTATCEIIRSDDPRHPFTVTWTLKKNGANPSAEEAGLLGKDVWKKYPASMLKSRAITQCARDACEEVLFGLAYTPEELGAEVDEDGVVVAEVAAEPESASERLPNLPWADQALERAATFTTEAQGNALWREAAAMSLKGDCTPHQKDHIQNTVTARIHTRRREASDAILRQLSQSDDWRAKVEELDGDDIPACREALAELGRLKTAGTVNETRAGRIGRAIIALCPKAALPDPEAAA
jgi:hypothetical protein